MINIKVKLKIFLILFVIFFSIYTIYLYNSDLYEGLQGKINKQIKDCSDCSIKPSSGNCLTLYEFSMNLPTSIPNTNDFLEIDVIDTSYIFCPWEPKCNDDICKNTIKTIAKHVLNIKEFILENFKIFKILTFFFIII